MYLIRRVLYNKLLSIIALAGILCLFLVFLFAACWPNGLTGPALQGSPLPTTSTAVAQLGSTGLLPGEQTWKQGASSYLFGTNDTYEWSNNNIQTQPLIQQALRAAGVTLIRSFFPDNASDAAIEQRIRTIENSNAHCLGVLTNINNFNFNSHLITYLGKRCQMYEFGNESDLNGISIGDYLKAWNKYIPLLRRVNAAVKFIGPVTYNDQGNHNFMQDFLNGVRASQVLPDAISFHWYPCYNDSESSCLAKANSYAQVVAGVRTMVQQTLGKNLPIGVTEWNYDPGNPPPSYGDNADFIKQFTTAAIRSMIQAKVDFACQFDAASYSGYGRLDMFDVDTNQPKPQYYALKDMIQQFRPASSAPPTPILSPSPTADTSSNGPLISRGKPVYCYNNDQGAGGTQAIVDGHYGNWSFWRPSFAALPSWCAIQVGVGPSRLLMTWESDYTLDYESDTSQGPAAYTISVSSDSTNGADGTWQTVTRVTGNDTHGREHLLPFSGKSWVKMNVTAGLAKNPQKLIFIDEVDLFDVSSDAALNDSFFFSGDSITATAYVRTDTEQPSYAELVHGSYPAHFPAMINGGLGGWSSDGAVQYIDQWLALNPDMHYWPLEWGTNDAFNQVSTDHFRVNLQTLVDKIKQAGHVPVLAHIPYSSRSDLDSEIRALNGVIDQVTSSNGLLVGPNLYTIFANNAQQYLLSDGVHPTDAGARAMNLAWFQALKSSLYK